MALTDTCTSSLSEQLLLSVMVTLYVVVPAGLALGSLVFVGFNPAVGDHA
jgi:hypothetical protein